MPIIAAMLDQVRKGGLHMVLAHQHLGHFIENPRLKKSVLTNARIKAGKSKFLEWLIRQDLDEGHGTLQNTDRPEGKNKLDYFLEADRSTMSHARMETKIVGYTAYHQQGRYLQKYPDMKFFQVATITQTRSRAESLKADLQAAIPNGARRSYHFVAFEDLTPEALLPAPATI